MVGQRVLAIHPKTRELRTASLLTSDVRQYHAQFDRPELGVCVISDTQLIPISGNEYYLPPPDPMATLQLNNLRNLYLQNKFQSLFTRSSSGCDFPQKLEEEMNFIPFEQTSFNEENRKALAMLILLFERKNALIEDLKKLNDAFERNPIYTESFR